MGASQDQFLKSSPAVPSQREWLHMMAETLGVSGEGDGGLPQRQEGTPEEGAKREKRGHRPQGRLGDRVCKAGEPTILTSQDLPTGGRAPVWGCTNTWKTTRLDSSALDIDTW